MSKKKIRVITFWCTIFVGLLILFTACALFEEYVDNSLKTRICIDIGMFFIGGSLTTTIGPMVWKRWVEEE